jgi:hypothetical protein
MKIRKKNVLIIIVSMIAILVFEIVCNWDGSQQAFLS